MKKLLAIILFLPLLLQARDGYRVIKDMDDQMVEAPANPQRIACMHGVSTDRIVTLGRGASLVMAMKASPWALKLYPEMKNVEVINPPFTGNIEKMISLKVDLVLYSPFPGEAAKYRAAGMSAACSFAPNKRPRSMEDFGENFKRQFRFFGELLGGDAANRAEKYCAYFDKKMGKILALTSKLKDKDKPSVYYGGRTGGNLLTGQGKDSVLHWFVKAAGGNFSPAAIDSNFVEVNMEKVISWDSDIILISGWGNTLDSVKKNPAWATMRAVKNNKVYLIPQGIFAWEFASGESVLMTIYMAKIFHPWLFADWDMIKEMTEFYSEIYGKKITAGDAQRILNCLPPL